MNQENNSLVSIIIPTYNRAKILPTCIQSCLDQTYKNIEIIVVDDGSTDNTAEVVTHFNEKNSRIILLKTENGGLSKALNYGFKFAKGEYLTWTSDDNYYAEDAIQAMLAFLKQTNYFLVYCDYYRFKKGSPKNSRKISCPDLDAITQDNCIGPCFLYSRKVMEIIGEYDPETKLAEDYDYWLRVYKKLSICHCKKVLYYYMEHNQSLSLRYYKNFEIQLVSTLVKLKNGILDIKQTINKLIELLLKKNLSDPTKLTKIKSFFYTLITRKNVSYLWDKFWILNKFLLIVSKCRFYKRIASILSDFKLQRINFTDTILALKNILGMNSS